jgi:choline kinase
VITRALILAAGKGVAIGDPDTPNCLAPVGGRALLDRTLALLDAVGIQKIGIVVGYGGAAIRRHVAALGRRVAFFENA